MLANKLQAGGAASSLPIEYVGFTSNTANATSITLTKPTGTAQGDLMVLIFTTQSSLTTTLPSGWTTVVNTHTNPPDLRTVILYKVAGASEPASYSVSVGNTRGLQGGILTYRYATYNSFSGLTISSSAATLNVSITPVSTDSTIIHYSALQNATDRTSTPITGFTEIFENYTSGSSSVSNLQVSHVIPVNATDTTVVSNTWSTAGGMAAAFIELIPA